MVNIILDILLEIFIQSVPSKVWGIVLILGILAVILYLIVK
jgi:hypothetical protein